MNKTVTLFTFSVALIILFVGIPLGWYTNTSNDQTPTWQQMSQQQLINELNGLDTVIVDLREEILYEEGHIPGAVNIPFAEITTRFTELDKNKKIIFVCHTGNMGESSSQFLIKNGFSDVANLSGGMAGWSGPIFLK
ncbi:rhodanese-like domain-containing protein [Chengkuizengella axinellae]|uniref:Rhodanese-like domain-containing protein n=1 Tax=Chengkuizengella axinellae TaxID=3064388 RepID=A0ABT9J7X4_9BACL|nr:rhodanese-like domain-containing protein [Chengkuizengella sp. 2205SS18-9]MDP5277049.1 rhodanese-like domain-containing protein [Chengkuizengella sp. 2205SS18-9]